MTNMTIRERKLLLTLQERAGQWVSRGELLRLVWNYPPHLRTRTVDVHICWIRQKLGPELRGYLQSAYGRGYTWTGPALTLA
jgi:two-component system, OmpR family, alkaline phosphatase synthesis response regulator PhoP